MKQSKVIASFLVFIMLVGTLPQGILANPQKPIREIQKVTVTHVTDTGVDREGYIIPHVQVDWIPPEINDSIDNASYTPVNTDSPTHYDFTITNINDGNNTGQIKDVQIGNLSVTNNIFSVRLEKYFSTVLKSGALYKVNINAKHKHTIRQDNGSYQIVDAPSAGGKIPEAYFITDFDIQADVVGGLTFSWEYIPGVSYRLYYEKGIFNSAADMPKTGINITADMAKGHVNEENRVEWTIESAVAGQIYSAYVVPTGISGNQPTFDEIAYNSISPKVVQATPNIRLDINKLGQNTVRLSWNIKDAAWVQVDNKLYQTVIWEIDEKGEEKELGRIYNDNNGGNDVGYFETSAPSGIVSYRVEFILKDTEGNIKKGFSAGPKEYIPEELREVPFQPRIPELFPYKLGDRIASEDIENQNKYKVKFKQEDGREDYYDVELKDSNIGELIKNTFNYQINNQSSEIQIVWDAPVNPLSKLVDYSLYYDIWISENGERFEEGDKVLSNFKVDEGQSDHIVYKKNGTTVVGFKTTITGLKTNKTYYIKMIAKRKYSNKEYTASLPAIKQVHIEKTEDIYEPPVVGKPPLQITSSTKDSVSVKWAEEWYEIMAKPAQATLYTDPVENLLATWGHSRVYLDTTQSPILRFKDNGKPLTPIDLYGEDVEGEKGKLQQIKQVLGEENFDLHYIQKYIRLGSNTRYKVKVMKQTEVDQLRGNQEIEEWVKNIDQSEVEYIWEDITDTLSPTSVGGVNGQLATFSRDYKGENLQPNTRYIILISAYRNIDNVDYYSAFPSFILATTATDHVSVPETPKVPRLYNYESKDVGDTEVAVRWMYNTNFEYELRYSTLDDPETAIVWEFTNQDKKTFVNNAEAYVTITGLSPETTYNFWLRAKQKTENSPNDVAVNPSDWSTPVTSTTKTLSNPLPPSGLGLADKKSILEAGQDFNPRSGDYLTVEWMKNPNDVQGLVDSRVKYSYIVEFADNVEFLDSVVVNTDGTTEENEDDNKEIDYEIITENLIRFTNLRANMPYYVKVKTVLTFTDGEKVIIKESIFTDWVRILTSTSSGEYDGGESDNIVTYPNAIEETYQNGIWTYKIVDATKVITQIQAQKKYFYTITLENYNNRYDATVRRIEMPKKVLDTLINQSMALQVVTNKGIYEIPGKALQTYANQYHAKDVVRFDFTQMNAADLSLYGRSYPEYYKSGERLEITIQNTPIQKLQTYMTVKLKQSGVSGSGSSLNTYQYQYASGSWQKYPHSLDSVDNNYVSYSTAYTGLNALYETIIFTSSNGASYAMSELAQAYQIGGLGTTYTKTRSVGASQYVNLLLGIQLGRTPINLSASASANDYARAKAAGLYVSSNRGAITKEQALAGVVKLYEITHGYQIKPSNQVFDKVSTHYKQAASKAYAIGLIESMENPQSTLNYEMLCDWIIQVIQ